MDVNNDLFSEKPITQDTDLDVTAYIGVSCQGNPGQGSYSVILMCNRAEKVLTGTSLDTTNNKLSVLAVNAALNAIKKPCRVKVVTNSKCLISRGQSMSFGEMKADPNDPIWLSFYYAFQNVNIVSVDFIWVSNKDEDTHLIRAKALAYKALRNIDTP